MDNLNVDSKLVEDFASEQKNYLAYWLSSLETYSPNKVKSLCLLAGTSGYVADKVAGEIGIHADENTKMSEIRPLIFALLQQFDPEAAKRFRASELYVRTSTQNFERFNKDKIIRSLVKEAGLTEELADEISNDVENFIKTSRLDYVSSTLVREIVNVKLLERRLEGARRMYTRLGTPIFDVEEMINRGVSTDIKRENANLQHTPETINWIISGEALEQYAMLKLVPSYIADSHLSGDFHIHILSNLATRPNCIQHYPPLFFKHGLKVDGTGQHTSVAKSAAHLTVAIQHCAKILLAAQTQMAGGQSIDSFNVWLAPFIKGLSDREIRQAAQEFIYELNQSYVARGGQVVFSNVDFELTIPNWLKDVPAIGPKGKVVGVYGDYEEESRKFLNEYIKLKLEGDATGKQHMWPNDVFKIRPEVLKGSEFDEELKMIHEYIAKYGTPYIANGIPEWQTENFNYMGCRTRLDSCFAGPWGTLRTGNDLYITLNLPRIAYQSRGNDDKFFELLDERLKKMADMLILKHNISDGILDKKNLLPFLGQKFESERYYQLKNTTKTFGYAGLTEAVKYHTGAHLHEGMASQNFGYNIIKYIRDYAGEMTKSTGLRFSVIASPAETCAARLSKLDTAKFGSKNVIVSGSEKAPYYTNSHMVKMDADIPLSEKIAIEQAYHPLTNGGHIFHIWLGEQSPSAEALMELTKKLCLKTNIGFFAYTKDFTVCNPCSDFSYGLKNLCPRCQSPNVTSYSRITGYYQAVQNFNASKKQELKDRYRYSSPGISA